MAKKPKKINTHGEKISADSLFTAPTVGSDSSVVNETAPSTPETTIVANAPTVDTPRDTPSDDYTDGDSVEPPADVNLHVFNKNGKTVVKHDPVSYRAYHDSCAANFDNDACKQFLVSRGFVDSDFDTLRAFRIGFDADERRLIIPHSDFDHTARTVADGKPKFKNPVGEKPPIYSLFNVAAIADNDIVAVTEAAFDSLSLIVCGIPAVAAHGTGGTTRALLAAIDADTRPHAVLIGYDNDKSGNDFSEQLAIELDKRGVLHERLLPPSELKDFNDALKADRDALIADIAPRINSLRDQLAHQQLLISARNNPIDVLDRVAVDILAAPNPDSAAVAAFSEHALLAAATAADHQPALFDIYRNLVKRGGITLKTFDRQIKKHLSPPRPNKPDYSALNTPLDVPPIVYVIKERLMRYKKSQAPVPCVQNFDLVFDHDPVLKDILGYNFFAQRIELRRVPDWYSPLQKSFFDRAGFKPMLGYAEGDDAAIQNYVDRTYQLRHVEIFKRVVIERANQNMFHPVQDYFNSLPSWDGTPRAERLFIDYLGADDNEYTRTATIKWLLAAAARIFQPACQFDYCLVLQGKQGIGKTTILSMLGGKWFGELDSIQGKDSVENIQGKWIIELAEMQATKKAENEVIKSFISRQTDFVRLPYERRARAFPRQCVLAATTNDSEVLRDQTGGRRFWFLECRNENFNVTLGADDIPQIWAEVFHLYNQLFADGFDSRLLDLPDHLKVVARELQASNTDGSDLRGLISAFLDRPVPRYEFWQLLTKEERKEFFRGSVVYLPFNRIAASKVKLPCPLDDIKDLCINVSEDDDKKDLRIPLDPLGDKDYKDIDRRDIFGDGKRMKVSPVEILNECFDGERSRLVNTRKIADIMRTLDGWQYQRGAVADPFYGRQATSFVRIAQPDAPKAPGNELEHVDDVDIPF